METKELKIEPKIVGKTFDDFLLRPQKGIVEHRGDVELKSAFSRNISLNFPIVSANMDTVTESKMAIAIAQHGGIGIIHRNLSIAGQAKEAEETKRAENFIIANPYTILSSKTIREAKRLMEQKNVGTLPVVNKSNELLGLLTDTMILFCDDDSQSVFNWMLEINRGLQFSKKEILSAQEARQELLRWKVTKLPLVDGMFKLKGLIMARDIDRLLRHKVTNKDSNGRLRVGAAIGATGDFLERAAELIRVGVDVLVMDIAHGHSTAMEKGVKEFREKFPDFELICGNTATREGALFLKELGADGIKVGVGPGLGCRTRLETGAGVAQLQAIREIYLALRGELPIIADGGVRHDKDFWIALAFGADCVMVGSHLAGTDEAPGDIITEPGTGLKSKIYRGMTAPEAKLENSGDAPEDKRTIQFIEGQERKVPYRGAVNDVLNRIREHLQGSVSYMGEKTLEEARKKTIDDPLKFFTLLSEAAKRESFER